MKTINSQFQVNDPSLESQWRAIILFGDNTATYKFAFAKALLEQVEMQKTEVRLEDLALPFAKPISEHLSKFGKQGTNNNQSPFINACRKFGNDEIDESALLKATLTDGFKYVIDAFHNVNGAPVPIPFYEKNFEKGNKKLILTDDILSFKDKFQFQNLEQEVEARLSGFFTTDKFAEPEQGGICFEIRGSQEKKEKSVRNHVSVEPFHCGRLGLEKQEQKTDSVLQVLGTNTRSRTFRNSESGLSLRKRISHSSLACRTMDCRKACWDFVYDSAAIFIRFTNVFQRCLVFSAFRAWEFLGWDPPGGV